MVRFEDIINHRDVSIKFVFKSLGELIHNYWGFEGEYIGLVDTEVVNLDGINLRKDISYSRTGKVINDVEMQTVPVDDEKAEAIGFYVEYDLRNTDNLVHVIILTNVDPEKSVRRIKLTDSLIVEPEYIYISPEDIDKMLNNIRDKIVYGKELTRFEELEFIIIAIFAPNNKKEEITAEISHLFAEYCEYTDMKFVFKSKITLVLGWMIDRNVSEGNKKEELWDVIGLEKGRDAFQEYMDDLMEKKNKVIHKQSVELKEKDIQLDQLNNQVNQIKKLVYESSDMDKIKQDVSLILLNTK